MQECEAVAQMGGGIENNQSEEHSEDEGEVSDEEAEDREGEDSESKMKKQKSWHYQTEYCTLSAHIMFATYTAAGDKECAERSSPYGLQLVAETLSKNLEMRLFLKLNKDLVRLYDWVKSKLVEMPANGKLPLCNIVTILRWVLLIYWSI